MSDYEPCRTSIDRRQVTTGGSVSVDRRQEYYNRLTAIIQADPLDFYTRAENGRKLLSVWFFKHNHKECSNLEHQTA